MKNNEIQHCFQAMEVYLRNEMIGSLRDEKAAKADLENIIDAVERTLSMAPTGEPIDRTLVAKAKAIEVLKKMLNLEALELFQYGLLERAYANLPDPALIARHLSGFLRHGWDSLRDDVSAQAHEERAFKKRYITALLDLGGVVTGDSALLSTIEQLKSSKHFIKVMLGLNGVEAGGHGLDSLLIKMNSSAMAEYEEILFRRQAVLRLVRNVFDFAGFLPKASSEGNVVKMLERACEFLIKAGSGADLAQLLVERGEDLTYLTTDIFALDEKGSMQFISNLLSEQMDSDFLKALHSASETVFHILLDKLPVLSRLQYELSSDTSENFNLDDVPQHRWINNRFCIDLVIEGVCGNKMSLPQYRAINRRWKSLGNTANLVSMVREHEGIQSALYKYQKHIQSLDDPDSAVRGLRTYPRPELLEALLIRPENRFDSTPERRLRHLMGAISRSSKELEWSLRACVDQTNQPVFLDLIYSEMDDLSAHNADEKKQDVIIGFLRDMALDPERKHALSKMPYTVYFDAFDKACDDVKSSLCDVAWESHQIQRSNLSDGLGL